MENIIDMNSDEIKHLPFALRAHYRAASNFIRRAQEKENTREMCFKSAIYHLEKVDDTERIILVIQLANSLGIGIS